MKIETRPLIGLCPAVEPKVTRVVLTAAERTLLTRAAALLDSIRDAVQSRFGEDMANADPWIDLALGASGIRDLLEDNEIV